MTEYCHGWVDLVSANPEYKPRHLTDNNAQEMHVIGKVIQVLKLL